MTNIALSSLKKVYPNNSIALNGVDLAFVGNGLVTIIGESGSGKTTLLNIIGLLDSATEGTISINNESIYQ
jgi:putative ABC transport system ATP-binding protein